jgi:hypothetical protein
MSASWHATWFHEADMWGFIVMLSQELQIFETMYVKVAVAFFLYKCLVGFKI